MDNPFGLVRYDAFSTPFGLRPRAPLVSPPIRPAMLPPMYAPAIGMPAMARRMAPGMQMLASMGRQAANVIPLPILGKAAGVMEGAASTAAQMGDKPISATELTNWIRKTESGGNYQALNREKKGNTASGAYQYTDSTWNGYGGYPKAMLAPREVQDRRFAEDIQKRLSKYKGDPFKAIAEHYLPAYANNPRAWTAPIKLQGGTVQPVANYVRKVIRGTPLEAQFDEYLARH